MEADLLGLLEEIRENRPEAFDHFLAAVNHRVVSFSRKVCGEGEDAKDALQETLLAAFQSLPRLFFKDPKALNVWLYKVAKNACLMMHRKSKFEPDREIPLDQFIPGGGHPETKTIEIPDWSNIPEDTLMKREVQREVRQAIAALPPNYRLVLVLRDMEQLTAKEVAEVLEISEKNVKIRLHRARLFLRKELEKHFLAKAAKAVAKEGPRYENL